MPRAASYITERSVNNSMHNGEISVDASTVREAKTTNVVLHPLAPEDAAAMAALRKMVEPNKGKLQGKAARGPYDEIMMRVAEPHEVSFEEGVVGGITGWWCRPQGSEAVGTILHLHGGWYNFGSANGFRNLVGQIASAVGANAFIPDYRLAPESRFPAAVEDVQACYTGMKGQGFSHIAITGDSAGGGLALVLSALLSEQHDDSFVGTAVMSPTTDLALTGQSWSTRAEADPYFVKEQVVQLVEAYLGSHDRFDPLASPLYGRLVGLKPVRIHVGDDEVLLDDSKGYFDKASAAGVDITLDVWEGMAHGFLSGVGRLKAANEALTSLGSFLRDRFKSSQEWSVVWKAHCEDD